MGKMVGYERQSPGRLRPQYFVDGAADLVEAAQELRLHPTVGPPFRQISRAA
jgi:hypothetical protein